MLSHIYFQPTSDQRWAQVKIAGQIVDRFELVPNQDKQEILYQPATNQYNLVEIDGDKIRIKADNSPDQVAVAKGWISQPGQTLICLPHQFIIEIQGENKQDSNDLILPLPD